MAMEKVWSVCGMCTVRCHIEVDVENGDVLWIEGNRHAGLNGSLCPRGGAGRALLEDNERPPYPMIRAGERGEGRWRQASWDEAFDYVAEKLKGITKKYGERSILFSDRGGPFTDLHKAFVWGLGSPNYCNHDQSCARNTHHAAQSVFGFGRKGVAYDLKNASHVVLQTRNIFEAINVKECKDLTAALAAGCKLTAIDIRSTITATRATDFFMVRPGSDYAFNLAVIQVLIHQNLFNARYVRKWVKDFDKLAAFVKPYTPEWAEAETGVPAGRIAGLAKELAQAAPAVIWHPGWNTARYRDSFYVARTAYIINALLGSIGAKGGMPFVRKAGDVGRKGLKSLASRAEKPKEKRADGVGWKYPHLDAGPGLIGKAFEAIVSEDPYPVKAYFCHRHDPLMALPDPEKQKEILDKLDLLVSSTFSWSDTAWYADVVLPMSTYLERESIIAHKGGLKPYFFVRRRAVEPRYDTRADWEIFTGLSKKMGIEALNFDSIEDIWKFQLKGTGVSPDDFKENGLVPLADKPTYIKEEEFKFKTPSGKIEIVSEKWESQLLPSLKPYEPPTTPPEGSFRITFGRVAQHTQGHTVNNPLLGEVMSENELWIHTAAAAELGVTDGEVVEVSNNGYAAAIKAKVTDGIHPECVFMVHGFGHKLPVETRAYGKGVADQELRKGGLKIWDPAGGALALQEHFVKVKKMTAKGV